MTLQEEQLAAYRDRTHKKTLTKVGSRVYHFAGYAHSDIIAIVGQTSVILVDAGDCVSHAQAVKEELARLTDKPVTTLIYTHGHPDHRGGAAAFRDTLQEIIAFTPVHPGLPYNDRVRAILMKRGKWQFGLGLSEDEIITQGLGPREAIAVTGEKGQPLPPTTVYDEGDVMRTIDGVRLVMLRTPGETDDALSVWLPDDGALCCGDLYYSCWPNVYAIRGGAYRNIADWIDSLSRVIDLEAPALLGGHHQALLGADIVRQALTCYRDALQSVLDQTLDCINEGLDADQAAERVKLPEALAAREDLGEFYGTIAFAVRSIYTGYLGWFDGNTARLLPSPRDHYNAQMVDLIGKDKLLARIDQAIKEEDYQFGLELCQLLPGQVEERRKACLVGRASQTTSSNARNWYLSQAKI